MREHAEMSTSSLYSTIPLLPEFESSFASFAAEGEFGMEGLRRAMLSAELMDDSSSLAHLHGSSMDYETDSLHLSESADLCKLSQMNLQSSADPILLDRSFDDGYQDDEAMYTELTSNQYREYSPGSTGDSNLDQELSDCSSSESGLESPSSAVRWETIAECPVVAISMDPDGPLPPVSDIFSHRPTDDFLGLSNRRPMPMLIKKELPDSGDDSLDGPPPSYHHSRPHTHPHPHPHPHSRRHTATTGTSTTTNNSNHHDYTTTPSVDENNNELKAESSRRIPHSKTTPLTNGEKAQRKKPGRKKGQVSKVLHLWEFIRDLLSDPTYCPSIINWENETEGVFRVLQSSEVARLWGEKKKNKKTMTYEKLSRSLRYSRKEGYFDALPKDKGYPKKLCFKFGPKSHGWREYNVMR